MNRVPSVGTHDSPKLTGHINPSLLSTGGYVEDRVSIINNYTGGMRRLWIQVEHPSKWKNLAVAAAELPIWFSLLRFVRSSLRPDLQCW